MFRSNDRAERGESSEFTACFLSRTLTINKNRDRDRAQGAGSRLGQSRMYYAPGRLDDALAILKKKNAVVLSGGTDYFPAAGQSQANQPILDISRLDSLRRVEEQGDGTWILGALTTWTDVIKADLPPAFDGLKLAAREVGSVQIQNRATVAGNLCNASPAADGVPPLLTLDAVVRLQSLDGIRDMPLSDFIQGNRKTQLQPGELVTEIRIPAASARGRSGFLKLGARKYLVISIAMVAARVVTNATNEIEDIAISVGACSAVAKRLKPLEDRLIGAVMTPSLFSTVGSDDLAELAPLDDVRASRTYRLSAAEELVRRTLTSICEGS